MNQALQFRKCYELAQEMVKAYRSEAPEGCDPQASGVYLAIATAAVGAYGAYSSSKSAKEQAAAQQGNYADIRKLFGQRQPGMEAMAGLEELLGFEVPRVNPLDFQDEGFDLTRDSMAFMREEGNKTFANVLGSNLPLFEELLTGSLERANFDFSSLPPEITRTLEGSALAQAQGGPAGLAENLSVENKLKLQQSGEQTAFRALGFKQGFQPDLLNPIDTTMQLANFELQNNQLQLQNMGMKAGILGQMGSLESNLFALEAGLYQPNPGAGLGAAAQAQYANVALSALNTYAATSGSTGRSYGSGGGGQYTQGGGTMAQGAQPYGTGPSANDFSYAR